VRFELQQTWKVVRCENLYYPCFITNVAVVGCVMCIKYNIADMAWVGEKRYLICLEEQITDKSCSALTVSRWSVEGGYSKLKHRNKSAKHYNDIEEVLVHGAACMYTNETVVRKTI